MSVKSMVARFKVSALKSRTESEVISFPSDLQSPRHVLVCLPGGLRELTIVKQFLPTISDMFRPAEITLLSMPGVKVKDIFPRKGFQILTPPPEQISWSGLPKKSFMDNLIAMKFD